MFKLLGCISSGTSSFSIWNTGERERDRDRDRDRDREEERERGKRKKKEERRESYKALPSVHC